MADLTALGITYNENSVIEVYVLPNQFYLTGPPANSFTTYVPGGNCGGMGSGEWTSTEFSIDVDATYEQMTASPANCSFTTNELFTCCSITPFTANPPAAANVQCTADIPAVDINSVTGIVNDCGTTTTFLSDVSDGNTCPEAITRTYRITDDCGNFIDVIQIITIDDTQNPTASNLPAVNVECINNVPANNIADVTDEADNCGTPTVAFVSDVSDGNTCPEVITRTYSITDDCGNTISVSQTITVLDITPPTSSQPGPINVECIADVPLPDPAVIFITADNCVGGSITKSWVSDVSDGNTCPEVITRTYSVTDDCGNELLVVQIITVDDVTPPTASNLPAVLVECIGDVPANNIADVFDEADNCTAVPVVAFVDDVSDGNTCPEVITRTYSITDDCGNVTLVTQIITVDDITDPTASNLPNINTSGAIPPFDITLVTDEADNCSIPDVAFVSDVSDGGNCPETITRTYSVTDACGNTINVIQLIIVGDAILPTASAPANINVECLADVPAADPLVITDEADNGGVPTVAFVGDVSDGLSCPETITRTYSITDNCGNVITVDQIIIVDDITAPTASNPTAVAVECIGDVPAIDITVVTDEADNCTAVPVVAFVSDVSDGNTCPEVITRTYSITDDCANVTLVTQIITVDDITPPTASNLPAVLVECIGDVPINNVTDVTDEADNCTAAPVVVFVSDVSDGNTCPEVITRTYSITDDCGNVTLVTQTITVDDVTDPTASNLPNINTSGVIPPFDITLVTDEADNCSVPVVAFVSDVSDGGNCPETITRSYSVTDACGKHY